MASQVITGWNNAGSLADISKQPRVEFISYGVQEVAGDGLTYEDGYESCVLLYDFLTEAEYSALMTEFGMASAASAKVTLRVEKNIDRTEQNYNAVIRKPSATHDRGLWINVSFPVDRMETI